MIQVVTAGRFLVYCAYWTVGLGFSELSGFTSEVDHHEYSYNDLIGNVHTKQFGRAKAPSLTLKRGLDGAGFAQLFAWHELARMNSPLAKVPAYFEIRDAAGQTSAICLLENAWCSKLEIDSVTAGSSNVVMMKTTIQCDSILLA